MVRDPIGFFERMQRRYGPVFRVRFPGYPNYVYVATAELAREVYAADRTVGRAGDARRDFFVEHVGEHSLLCTEGEEWLQHRKLLGPAFHRRVVDGYREEIAAIAREEMAGWPLGEPFALRPRMQAITLEVILRLVFGLSTGPRLERLRTLLGELIEASGSEVLYLIPAPWWQTIILRPRLRRIAGGPLWRFLVARAEADRLLFELIAERRAAGTEGRTDALSIMVGDGSLTDQAIRDELMTLLQAGHETTATALAWAFERLSRTPRALARLTEEVRGGDGEDYLKAVVRETLRARPVVIDSPRMLAGPLEVGGHTIPKGWMVAPAIPLVQDAGDDDFRPERFLDGATNEGWIPFGGGKRHCVGSHLALTELEVVIAEVVGTLDVAPADPAPERPRVVHVTLSPSEQARVVVQRGDDRIAEFAARTSAARFGTLA
jgi:cytochrome P450